DDIARKFAAVFGNDLFGGRMKLPRAAVVAQAFPETQHFGFFGGSKFVDGRKRGHEPLEVIAHRGDLRLLQHDLADPYAVRVARFTPRQIAGMIGVPRKQPAAKRLLLRTGELGRGLSYSSFAIRRGGHANYSLAKALRRKDIARIFNRG